MSTLDLPVRILPTPGPSETDLAEVVSVDGATGHPGLQLSHWPGNTTPASLRHDLSTGCALAFARLEERERCRLAGAATAFANNHYDTDGTLALFAARHPERALPRAERMLRAAAAGDFFRWPDDDALALDAIVGGLSHSPASPLAADLEGLDDLSRWERCTHALLDELPAILDGDVAPWRELWEPVLDDARLDRDDLGPCAREEDGRRDLALWTAPRGARSTRASASDAFDPGRHVLFGATTRDRVLVIAPRAGGASFRLVVSTLSWFDLVTETRLPRPDLVALAGRLDELEGTSPSDELAWRAQSRTNASPELWFGRAELDSFAEHNGALTPSALAVNVVRAEIERALLTSPS